VKRAGALLAAALALTAPVLLAGCGGATSIPGDQIPGRTLAVYASVPLHGASRVTGQAVINGAKVALDQIGGRIGRYRILLQALDDSTVQRGEWDPGQTTLNARGAALDTTTIGYLGELNSGASAISIPILNRAGIPQVSPASSAVGLTTSGPGASPGEPQKYYPTGIRTFARVVPSDAVQAVAQVKLQRSVGCVRTYVLDDGEVDGEDTATSFSLAAQSAGLQVVGVAAFDPRSSDYSPLALAVAQSGADCVLISAITENNAVLLTRQLASVLPRAKVFGSAGVAESTFTDPARGGIPRVLDPRVMVMVASADQSADPAGAARFLAAYTHRFGVPEPDAIYGYEAMSLLLASIARASDNGTDSVRRSRVIAAIFATRKRRSVLGIYRITRTGDTTLRRFGVYRVVDGRLSPWMVIDG
jgi:branched-chain amino acid transport system substrate-binding protein